MELRIVGFGFVNWKCVAPDLDPADGGPVVIGSAPYIDGGLVASPPMVEENAPDHPP